MIGGQDKITSAWGHVYPGGYDLFVQIVARAVKQGFHVHLVQPNKWHLPACTLSDRLAAKEHHCWHPLEPQENLAKVRPMVRTAVERATERYGSPLNVAIDLHPSGYSHGEPSGFATIDGPSRAWLVPGIGGRGGLQLVPPSVLDGEPFRCWSVCDNRG